MDCRGLSMAFANSTRQAVEMQEAMDAMHTIMIETRGKYDRKANNRRSP